MFADPDVPVQAKDEVHAARESDEVGFESADEYGGNRDDLTVPELKTSRHAVDEYQGLVATERRALTFPYLSDRVCSERAPSPYRACTSATKRSPSSKKVRIWSSSLSSLRRCTPPGRLTEESIRMPSFLEFTLTFHRFEATWTVR